MAVGQLNAVIQFLHAVARKGASKSLTDGELLQRFIRQHDEPAFESLVHKHGPMVLGVCQRVLRHDQDAEDAFQATFLVLVRKAAALRSPGTVANWLYGVANRTAREMKRAGVRRRAKEARAMPRSEPIPDTHIDFRAAFDEELALLPDKYREAVVLCDLQSKPRREAARELGCAEGTVASRLARGRALLAQRLVLRGVGSSAGAVAASLLGERASAQVPGLLASETARAAGLLAAGQPLSSIVSTSVVAATEGALKSMLLTKFKILAAVLMVFATCIGTTGLLYRSLAAETPETRMSGGSVVSEFEKGADESLVVTGKVVDEQGAAVSGVRVRTRGLQLSSLITTTDAEGEFRIELPDWPVAAPLLAEEAGGRQGILRLGENGPKTGLRIKLEAAREVKVKVVDARSAPVSGARVVLILDDLSTNFVGATGADGTTTLRYPKEAKPGQVLAFKSGVGFDYVSTLIAKREPGRKPLPSVVSLQLAGVRTVRVKAIDSANRPLQGIPVFPWYVKKPGMLEDVNLSGCESALVKTDAHGIATFDWLPAEFNNAIPFLCDSPNYSYTEQVAIKREAPVEDLTTPLLRNVKISGKVNWPDGRPASGIIVDAWGAGHNQNDGQGRARTRADGSYEMLVNSEEAYIVAVVDDRWAAPSHIGVLVREDKPVTGIDFTLAEGTILRGKVTVGSGRQPNPGEFISIRMSGGEIPKEIRKPGDRGYHEISLHRGKTTDAAGEYRICLGPGKYQVVLRSMIAEPKGITVGQEREIVKDFHMPRSEWGMLNGKVLDQNGQPVAGAAVFGAYMRPTGYVNLESVSAVDGSFKARRVQVPTALFAVTPDKRLAGIMRIDADQETATIRIGPTARARGRLLNAGGQIIANEKVMFGIQIPDGDGPNSSHRSCFGGGARSDAEGYYTLEGLVPGEKYEADIGHDPESGRILCIASAKPLHAETIQLGDTSVPMPPRLPSLEEKTAQFFNKRGNLAARIAQAQVEASRHYLRVLVIVGDPKDVKTRGFYELSHDPEALMHPLFEYEKIAVAADDKDSVALLSKVYGLTGPQLAVPALIVLAPEGKVLSARGSWLDDNNPQSSSAELKAFLKSHALPKLDAEKLLADVRQQARRDGKRVFLRESGTYCAPCRVLARFMEEHKAIFDPNYVFVEIDRTRFTHGEEVMQRLRTGPDHSIPWCAILDDEGAVLANWDSPDGNIGFPNEPKYIEHFLRALAATAPRLTPAQVEELRDALKAKR